MVGEHIRALKRGRWVHGIDCGDETVLHLAEEQPPRRVRRAYRPEFVSGADTVELVTHRERTFPPREVVRRAYSRAADPALAVMFHDSEAFADWCTTGRLVGPRDVALPAPAAPAAPAALPAARSAPPRERRRTARAKPRPEKKVRPEKPARRKPAPKADRGAKRRARKAAPSVRAKTARRAPKPIARKRRRR